MRPRYIHQIVAETFLDKPFGHNLTVDHIDRNKLNNNVSNLRWVTKSEQAMNRNTNGIHFTFVSELPDECVELPVYKGKQFKQHIFVDRNHGVVYQ